MIEPTFIGDEDVIGGTYEMDDLLPEDPEEESPDVTPPEIPEEETTFSTPSTTPVQPATVARVELLRDKLSGLYTHLGVPDNDPNLAKLDEFRLRLEPKSGVSVLEFFKNGDWVNLTDKRTGEWLSDATIKQRLGGESGMIRNLGLEETPDRFKRQKQAAKKLNRLVPTDLEMESLSLEDLSKSVVDVEHELKTDEDLLPMRELLGLDKALRRIQGELANNMAKLGKLDEHVEHETKKLRDAENDSGLSEEDKEFHRKNIQERLKSLKEEREARLELVSQNKKELSSQFSRIKQTIEKVLDSDSSLAEKIRTIFREQGVTVVAVITAFGLLISTIVGFLTGGGGGAGSGAKPPPKDEKGARAWAKRQLKRLADLLKTLGGKLGAALPGVIGTIVTWLFSLLSKTASFLAEHLWLLLVFVGGFVYAQLTKKSR